MANCHGRIVLTRYRSSDEVRLSTQAAAGNLAGNSDAWLLNALNLFKKFPRFESSPGHQIQILRIHFESNFFDLSDLDLPCQRARFYALFSITGCGCMSTTLEVVAAGSRANQMRSGRSVPNDSRPMTDWVEGRFQNRTLSP